MLSSLENDMKFNIKKVLEDLLSCSVPNEWLDFPDKIPEDLLKNVFATNEVVIAINRWKSGWVKKSNLLFRLTKTQGTVREATKICEHLDKLYRRHGAKLVDLKEKYLVNESDVHESETQLTPQLRNLRVKMTPEILKTPQRTKKHLKPIPYRGIRRRTVVRVVKIINNCNQDTERKQILRLKRRIESLKSDIRSLKETSQTDLAAKMIVVDQLKNECEKLGKREQFLEKELERTLADFAASEEELSAAREDVAVLQGMPEESLEKLLSDQTKIPSISLRESVKDVNPYLINVITQLRNVHKLSYSACLECFVCVSNGFFNQKYKLASSAGKTRRTRDLIPKTSREVVADEAAPCPPRKRRRTKIDETTMVSKSFVQSNQKVQHLLALKSIAEDIKKSEFSTGQIDGFSSHRDKGVVMGAMVKMGGNMKHLPISCEASPGGDAEKTSEYIMLKMRTLACLSSEDVTPEKLLTSVKEIADKFRFWVTDGGPQMKPAVERVQKWKQDMGLLLNDVWIHCNAHIEPALAGALTKVLLDIEEVLGVRKYALESFNASFFGSNSSCVLTMCYAFMNMLGPSKQNQEWSQTKNFAVFLKSVGETRNHLQDAKCSRFGKYPEFLTLMAYHFESIKKFMNETYETNKMFLSCQRYVNCPYFREICVAVSVLYFHILRPFLVAVGAEGVEGYKSLDHYELCSFYPGIISALKEASKSIEGAEKLLVKAPLEYLKDFPSLAKVSHKGHDAIFEAIFVEIQLSTTSLSVKVVKQVVSVIAEGYQEVFTAQTADFYLKGGKLKELLDSDPKCLDGVPTTALAIEHQVGEFRHGDKVAPTAKMETIGIQQVVAKSSHAENLCAKKHSKDRLKTMFKEARSDPRFKMAAKLLAISEASVRQETERQLAVSKARKLKAVENKKLATIRCQENHDGPILSVSRLDKVLRLARFKNSPKETFKLLKLEIFYYRDVVYESFTVPDKSIFVVSRKNELGKIDPKPKTELVGNLRQLINPEFLNTSAPTLPDEDLVTEQLAELHKRITGSNQLKEVRRTTSSGGVNLKEGEFAACYWQDEDETNTWYLGRISRIIKAKSCNTCQTSGLEELKDCVDEPCYEVHYLTKSDDSFSLVNIEECHTLASQVLCKVQVAALAGSRYKLESPSSHVLDSLVTTNKLCSALQ